MFAAGAYFTYSELQNAITEVRILFTHVKVMAEMENAITEVRILFTHVEGMAEKASASSSSDKTLSVSSNTLFVRNLPYSSKDADLEAAFAEYGSLKSCFTVKEKGGRQLDILAETSVPIRYFS